MIHDSNIDQEESIPNMIVPPIKPKGLGLGLALDIAKVKEGKDGLKDF